MQKVILVNPPPDYDRELYKHYDISMGVGAPLGLLLLATVLEKNGFATRIIDGQICNCHDELFNELNNGEVIGVGFSVMSSQYKVASQLSLSVKQLMNDMPIIWGGFHPTILPQETIRNSFVDFIVRGEGDKALLQLCRFLRDGGDLKNVGNIVYQNGDKVMQNNLEPLSSFDEIQSLNWNLLDNVELYVKKRNALGEKTRFINILTGLGCNFRCSFCHNAIFHKKHRTRKAIDIITEMNDLHEKYKIGEFGLVDENFFDDRKRLEEFLQLLKNNKYKFKWSSALRANYVNLDYLNKELLTKIAKLGGYYFGVGAESGNDLILKKLKKGIKVQNVLDLARWTKDIDMTITYSFIAGLPGESCAMTLDTLHLIKKIKRVNPKSLIIGPQVFRPYPGSPLYQEALQMGLKEPKDWNNVDDFLETLYHFKKIDSNALPWHNEVIKFKYMMLSFYLLGIGKTGNIVKDIVLMPFKFLSWLRFKTGFYSVFIEKPFLDFFNKRLS